MAKGQGIKRGSRFKDLSKEPPFGCLRVIRDTGTARNGVVLWECLCDKSLGGCGGITIVRGIHLRSGHTRSCGCFAAKSRKASSVTHGMTKTAEYRSWYAMKQRCTNPRHKSFRDYGGRGIRVCDRWLNSFENFLADMGTKPSPQHSIERKDGDGGYEPGNCVWATRTEQNRNTRNNTFLTHGGRTQHLSEWARELEVSPATLCKRIARGWSIGRTLTNERRIDGGE